jgi:hypothetical protein
MALGNARKWILVQVLKGRSEIGVHKHLGCNYQPGECKVVYFLVKKARWQISSQVYNSKPTPNAKVFLTN